MKVLPVHDPDRRPASWMEIIRPGQFVAFSQFIDGGGSCDADGRVFTPASNVTCLLFDDFAEARGFCEERVLQAPSIQLEIFDSSGRVNPPLLVIIHPAHEAARDGNPRGIRIRNRWAIGLAIVALGLFWFDYRTSDGLMILPTILGINMLIAAARFLQLNSAYADAERRRRERLAKIDP